MITFLGMSFKLGGFCDHVILVQTPNSCIWNNFCLSQFSLKLPKSKIVSIPSQDILSHYKMQQGAKMSRREELETPTFTNSVPA